MTTAPILRLRRFRGELPALGLLVLGLATVLGCKSAPVPVAYAREYPAEVTRVKESLDIQVFRRTYEVEFTNTTARAFGKSTLWLNRRFSYPIEGLAIGQHIQVRLKDCRDEFSDEFRGGGFFASEAPETLVMAELESPDADGKSVMYGMIVVRGNPE